VRLVACPSCRAHYDVTDRAEVRFPCACGAVVENRLPQAVDAEIRRCAACGGPLAAAARSCEWCRGEVERDPLRLSLICPECYARNGETARFCAACGVAFRPQPIPEPEPVLACVDCATPMAVRAVADVRVHECGRCGGLWAPGERLEQLVARALEEPGVEGTEGGRAPEPRETGGNPLETPVRYRRCPVCGGHMARRNWRRISGVVLDRCREHGTWLDADELERIAGFVRSGGLQRAQDLERREAERDAPRDRATSEFTRILMDRPRSGTLLESLVRLVERRSA
jgi:Zn-finger nucleic acid-binding protein